MVYPCKSISLGGGTFTIWGPSEDDPYYKGVGDDIDPEFTYLIQRVLAPDDVCIDVGANIGIKAIQLARQVPAGKVVAIEAGPVNFDVLSTGVRLQNLTNLIVEHAAVSDHVGTMHFAENSAYGHIVDQGAEVEATTLAAIVERNYLTRLDFVKIDVEGFEFPILRSSVELFAHHKTTVCFEFNSWCQLAFTDERPRECLEWLLATFPEIYILKRGQPFDSTVELVPPGGALNLLARNMFEDGHVTDLIITNRSGRSLFG